MNNNEVTILEIPITDKLSPYTKEQDVIDWMLNDPDIKFKEEFKVIDWLHEVGIPSKNHRYRVDILLKHPNNEFTIAEVKVIRDSKLSLSAISTAYDQLTRYYDNSKHLWNFFVVDMSKVKLLIIIASLKFTKIAVYKYSPKTNVKVKLDLKTSISEYEKISYNVKIFDQKLNILNFDFEKELEKAKDNFASEVEILKTKLTELKKDMFKERIFFMLPHYAPMTYDKINPDECIICYEEAKHKFDTGIVSYGLCDKHEKLLHDMVVEQMKKEGFPITEYR